MNILAEIGFHHQNNEMICIVGAGGKTSLMFNLAAAYKATGRNVLVTTTTKIFHPEKDQYDVMILDETGNLPLKNGRTPIGITCLGKRFDPNIDKIVGIEKDVADRLFGEKRFDCILVEGDGAKRKPIKAPGKTEPVIPGQTTILIGMVGLDALGTPADDTHVHRCEQFCEVTGLKQGDVIDEAAIARLITSPEGIFYNFPKTGTRIAVLNKADMPSLRARAVTIAGIVKRSDPKIKTLITAVKQDRVYPW